MAKVILLNGSPHPEGCTATALAEMIKVFEKENPSLPMRIDHGRLLTEDIDKGYNPGYSFLGRMLALGQIEGVMAAVRSELDKK